jgi:hypothetical protein
VAQAKLAWLIAISCWAVGCGSDSGDEHDPKNALIGKWGAEIPGSPDCVLAAAFRADNVYEGDTVCPLADGSYGVEAEVGDYSTDGRTIDFVPTAASCFEADRDHNPTSIVYSVTKTTLSLVRPSGAVVMQKVADDPNPSGNVVIHFGCANSDQFVRSDIKPL